MYGKAHSHSPIFEMSRSPVNVALTILLTLTFLILVIFFMMLIAQPSQAQSYQVIHYFSQVDGAFPYAGVAVGTSGEIYGTTQYGGGGNCTYYHYVGCGTAYRLSKTMARMGAESPAHFHRHS